MNKQQEQNPVLQSFFGALDEETRAGFAQTGAMLFGYYKAMLDAGFSKQQAFDLTMQMHGNLVVATAMGAANG